MQRILLFNDLENKKAPMTKQKPANGLSALIHAEVRVDYRTESN